MGLFSFTDEEYERYQGRKPVDPRALASEAMARISAARATEADAWVARFGPRAAWARVAEPGAPRVDDLRRAIDAIARRAPLGTPEAIGEGAARDAFLGTADDARAAVRCCAALAHVSRHGWRDRAATAAVAAFARLDAAQRSAGDGSD